MALLDYDVTIAYDTLVSTFTVGGVCSGVSSLATGTILFDEDNVLYLSMTSDRLIYYDEVENDEWGESITDGTATANALSALGLISMVRQRDLEKYYPQLPTWISDSKADISEIIDKAFETLKNHINRKGMDHRSIRMKDSASPRFKDLHENIALSMFFDSEINEPGDRWEAKRDYRDRIIQSMLLEMTFSVDEDGSKIISGDEYDQSIGTVRAYR